MTHPARDLDAETSSHPNALRVSGLCKAFGPTQALDGAQYELRRGTVHALLGGNGSGKSTSIKVLAGVYPADAGTIEIDGRTWSVEEYTAAAGRGAGLRFVHQDLGLFEQLSIAENFGLDGGYPVHAGRGVRWKALQSHVREVLERFEIDAAPSDTIDRLRPSQRTMVAIARALQDRDSQNAILILDEPTATLPAQESEVLLRAIRRRADLGQTIMMVSHRMQEVLSVAHDFTVFRDGRTVATLADASPTEDDLVALMTGRESGRLAHHAPTNVAKQAARDDATPRLEVRGLQGGPMHDMDLSVLPGEIVGVTGLVGSGRTSLLKTIFGLHEPAGGSITIDGRVQKGSEHIAARMAQGVAYVSEDRVGESSFATLTVRENLSASVLRQFWRPRGMDARAERASAMELVQRHGVKTQSESAVFSSLSGGNQQKAVIARWLRRDPTLLLLDEPTQGVDIMSREDIYRQVREVAAKGCAVVVASSDFVELTQLCDRVVVLQDGRTGPELDRSELSPDALTTLTQSSVPANGASL